jgi:integrase
MTEKLNSWIYPVGSSIHIREKINTSGQDAFGVSYAVTVPTKLTGGARKRKQFASKEQAEDWAKNEWTGFRKDGESYFEASVAERNEFADMMPKLREAGISLREAVLFALPQLRPAGGDRTLREVVDQLRASKKGMLERKTLREHSERAFRVRSEKIIVEFGDTLVRDLTLAQVKDWLEDMDVAPRTIKNHLNCLSEVIRYSVAREYVKDNVLDRLTDGDRRELYGNDDEKEPEILTPKEADRLILAAVEKPELGLLGAVALGLFCGIRTEELKKLDWKDVHLDEGFVTIGKDIAKKRSIRNVTISDNAKRWLSVCPNRVGEVARSNSFNDYQKRFQKLVKHAGFVKKVKDGETEKVVVAWKKNAMRHSFGSYHFALHGDSIRTSNELGHKQGDGVLFAHYRALSTKKQAAGYFAIAPEANVGKVVDFAS